MSAFTLGVDALVGGLLACLILWTLADLTCRVLRRLGAKT